VRIKYILLAMLTLLVILGCSVPNETTGTTPSNSAITNAPDETMGTISPNSDMLTGPSSPLSVDLTMERAPRLNETVVVTCTVKSLGYDAPDTTASINLPEGVVLVSGNIDWHGDLNADIPIEFSAVIKFTEEGKWIISAVANHVFSETRWWRDHGYVMLTVNRESGKFGWDDQPGNPAVRDTTYQPQPDEIPPALLPDPKGEEAPPPEE
jgi:hypothetical protein